ncbi:10512_t:CDS:2, partial [Acaulospora morrowiae]
RNNIRSRETTPYPVQKPTRKQEKPAMEQATKTQQKPTQTETENRWSQMVKKELGETSTSTLNTPEGKAQNKEKQTEATQAPKN